MNTRITYLIKKFLSPREWFFDNKLDNIINVTHAGIGGWNFHKLESTWSSRSTTATITIFAPVVPKRKIGNLQSYLYRIPPND